MSPTTNDLKSSKFLTKNDVEPAIMVTIKGYKQMNVAMESVAPEEKYVLYFNELEKPLVLNRTNGELISDITGSNDFDNWIGKKVVLWNDRTVSFAGKITGGIRVRAVAGQTNPDLDTVRKDYAERDVAKTEPDDIPF